MSGEIPVGAQFNTFMNDSYIGNPHLCGFPIAKACPEDGNSWFKDTHCSDIEGNIEHESDDNHEDKVLGMEINPLYISMAMGFSTGFWIFWGPIILIASWRHAYFRFLSNMNDKIYVTVVVTLNKLQRTFHTQQPPT